MDEDQTLAISCISIIPICCLCCIVAYCYENICKKRNKIEESNYYEIV